MYEQRNFVIFAVSENDKIDFRLVLETSADTLRRSVDGSKTFVKWDEAPFDPTPKETINSETGEPMTIIPVPPQPPTFLSELTTLEGPYSYEEILAILNTPEWTAPMEEIL